MSLFAPLHIISANRIDAKADGLKLHIQIQFSRPVYFSGVANSKLGLYPASIVDQDFRRNLEGGRLRPFHRRKKIASQISLNDLKTRLDIRSDRLIPGKYVLVVGSNFYGESGYPLTNAEGMRAAKLFYYEVAADRYLERQNGKEAMKLAVNATAPLRISVLPHEFHAQVDVLSDVPVDMRIWYYDVDTLKLCAGRGCPLRIALMDGEISRKKNRAEYHYRFELEGLQSLRKYHWILSATAGGKKYQVYEGGFETIEMPRLAINELMAKPWVESGDGESSGEYVEIYNRGDAALSLLGFRLQITGENGKMRRCSLYDRGRSIRIAPRDYALVVGSKFDAGYHHFPDATPIYRLNRKSLCGGLSNNSGQIVELVDAQGRVVSSYGGYWASKYPGRSIERVTTDAIDEKGSFCYSRQNFGPTPGRRNGVTARGCEPIGG